jgi:cytochrome c-type biogenesis protein
MSALLLSLLAGALTVVNPCVLPVLPIVLLGALQRHRFGPLALAGGMVSGFAALGILVYGLGEAFDLSSDTVREAGAVLLIIMGVVMLSGPLKERLAVAGGNLSAPLNTLLERITPGGLMGQFVTGLLLGAIWSPCSGPTLGSAITLAAQSGALTRAAAIMLFFGIGATLPMVALAYGSRRAILARRDGLRRLSRVAMPVLGVMLILIAIFVLTGWDKRVEATLIGVMPEWLIALTTRY